MAKAETTKLEQLTAIERGESRRFAAQPHATLAAYHIQAAAALARQARHIESDNGNARLRKGFQPDLLDSLCFGGHGMGGLGSQCQPAHQDV